jgi:hypothetical protein
MLSKWRKQVRDGELVGDPPPLEPQEAAELQRLRDVEKQFIDEVFAFIVEHREANRQAFPVPASCCRIDGARAPGLAGLSLAPAAGRPAGSQCSSVPPSQVLQGVCHCSDCQMLSGSAYRVFVRVPALGSRMLRYARALIGSGRCRQLFTSCWLPRPACRARTTQANLVPVVDVLVAGHQGCAADRKAIGGQLGGCPDHDLRMLAARQCASSDGSPGTRASESSSLGPYQLGTRAPYCREMLAAASTTRWMNSLSFD